MHSPLFKNTARLPAAGFFVCGLALLLGGLVLFKAERLKRIYVNWKISAPIPIEGDPRYEELLPDREVRRACEAIQGEISSFLRTAPHLLHVEHLTALEGRDGWLHFPSNLHTATLGQEFYGGAIPAIVDFQQQVSERGLRLLFVPLPTKWETHPESVVEGAAVPPSSRLNVQRAAFIEDLRGRGVEVLDLAEAFTRHRGESEDLLFYKEDTHWTPMAAEIAAREIAGRLGRGGSVVQSESLVRETVEIAGDLRTFQFPDTPVRGLPRGRYPARINTEEFVSDPASPILLLGDSYLFPDLGTKLGGTARMCGLPVQLCAEIGSTVDLCVSAGGGSMSRKKLAERIAGDPSALEGKKAIVWICSGGTFVYGSTGFPLIPLPKPGGAGPAPRDPKQLSGTISARCLEVSRFDPSRRHPYADALVTYLFEHEGRRFLLSRQELRARKPVSYSVTFEPENSYQFQIKPWSQAVMERPELETMMDINDTGEIVAERFLYQQ